jgi:hypothetical protein
LTVVHFTAAELRGFEDSYARGPSMRKLRDLTVDHARKQGGLTLAFWELHQGQFFGKPAMMTVDECAKRLGIPVSRAAAILDETQRAIVPRWKASPEYRDPC